MAPPATSASSPAWASWARVQTVSDPSPRSFSPEGGSSTGRQPVASMAGYMGIAAIMCKVDAGSTGIRHRSLEHHARFGDDGVHWDVVRLRLDRAQPRPLIADADGKRPGVGGAERPVEIAA